MAKKPRYFDSNAQVQDVVDILELELPDFLDEGVPAPSIIRNGSDFVNSSYPKPYCLVSAGNLDTEDDGQCILEDLLMVRIGAYVEAPDDERSLFWSCQYADAIRSVFVENDRLPHSYDVRPVAVDYYPGGTVNEKLCIVELELKTRVARG